MNNFIGFLATLAFIAFCGLALVANESAAVAGKYEGADQFLSSVMK